MSSLKKRISHKVPAKQRKKLRIYDRVLDVTMSTFEGALTLKENQMFEKFESSLLNVCLEGQDLDDRVRAVYELALYYCQIGHFEKADGLLRLLGFRYRLNSSLWNMSAVSTRREMTECIAPAMRPCACFDNVFPSSIIETLLDIFREGSPFWSEHNYPSDSFFSYNTPVGGDSQNIMTQLATYLLPLLRDSFPELNMDDITSIEWWAHSRPDGPCAGHRVSYRHS